MDSNLILATATAADNTSLTVLIDGATATCQALVPADLQGRLLRTSSVVGARLLGTRLGTDFLVVEIISGGNRDQYYSYQAGGFSTIHTNIGSGSFDCPAGTLVGTCSLSGYYNGTGSPSGSFSIQVDGSTVPGTGPFFLANRTNDHQTFAQFAWRMSIGAGVHTFWIYTNFSTTTDGNDYLGIRMRWMPV